MLYIVGLGNPGEKYAHTRHNVGWIALDAFVAKHSLPAPISSGQFAGHISQGNIKAEEVHVLYPDTYMNNSGSAVAKLVPKGEVERLVVLHDDIDLPLGEVKISVGRGDGGHNGLKSIITTLGSKEFVRVRIGIAKRHFLTGTVVRPQGGGALERFVLGDFSPKEQKIVREVIDSAVAVLDSIIEKGVQQAMNRHN